MADNKKVMQAVEDELQHLTGEIYLKLEERFTQLLTKVQSEQGEQPAIEAHDEYIKVQKCLDSAYQQIEQLNERLDLKQQQVNSLNSDNVELKAQLAKGQTNAHNHQQQLTQLNQEHNDKVASLTQQLNSLAKELDSSHDKNQQLSQELSELQKSANIDLTRHEQIELALQQEVASLIEQLKVVEKQQQNEQQALQNQLTQQQAKLEQIQANLTNELTLAEQALTQQQVEFNQQAQCNQTSQQSADDCIAELRSLLAQQEHQSEQKIAQLAKALDEAQAQEQLAQQNLQTLSDQVTQERDQTQARRDKEQTDYEKARETIKYLRDENFELSEKLSSSTTELEDKLQEYRLRFEYAQKQLAKQTSG